MKKRYILVLILIVLLISGLLYTKSYTNKIITSTIDFLEGPVRETELGIDLGTELTVKEIIRGFPNKAFVIIHGSKGEALVTIEGRLDMSIRKLEIYRFEKNKPNVIYVD